MTVQFRDADVYSDGKFLSRLHVAIIVLPLISVVAVVCWNSVWVLTLLNEIEWGGYRKRCQYDTMSPLSSAKTLQLKALKQHLVILCFTTDVCSLTWLSGLSAMYFRKGIRSYSIVSEALLNFSEALRGEMLERNKFSVTKAAHWISVVCMAVFQSTCSYVIIVIGK